jgi:hypothetical protein
MGIQATPSTPEPLIIAFLAAFQAAPVFNGKAPVFNRQRLAADQ